MRPPPLQEKPLLGPIRVKLTQTSKERMEIMKCKFYGMATTIEPFMPHLFFSLCHSFFCSGLVVSFLLLLHQVSEVGNFCYLLF